MKLKAWHWMMVGIATGGILIGGAFVDRNNQLHVVENQACRSYNTLDNIIRNQRSPRRVLEKLGFTKGQILILEENAAEIKAYQLHQLGTRPSGCEPGVVK